MKCMVCQSSYFKPRYSNLRDYEYGLLETNYEIIRCQTCGLLQLDPMPSLSQLAEFYPDAYVSIHGEKTAIYRFLVESYYQTMRRFFRKLLPEKASILDVGCSSGHIMGCLGRLEPQWKFTGVEMSQTAVDTGRKLGRNIIQGMFENVSLPSNSYDLVIMSHLIEHVADPEALLSKAFFVLKPGGSLYIETPNTNCVDYRLFGKYWGGLHYPRHTFLFSSSNISPFIGKIGFRNIKVSSSFYMFGWALSIQNYLVDKWSLRCVNGRICLYNIFMMMFFPIVLFQNIIGQTAGMRVVAEKA